MVGVGHAHFSLHLRPTKGGVDIARASPFFCLPQLRKPTPHISVIEERGEQKGVLKRKKKKKMEDEKRKTEEGVNKDSSERHGLDRVSKYTEHISTSNRVCVIVTRKSKCYCTRASSSCWEIMCVSLPYTHTDTNTHCNNTEI